MAATSSQVPQQFLPESSDLRPKDPQVSYPDSIPTVDFSQLISTGSHQRSTALDDLAKACQEWGFFMLINHGISETLMKSAIDASLEFFELPEEEKKRYAPKSALDPVQFTSGTIVDSLDHKIHLWRDSLKCKMHPEFHCPDQPQSLRDALVKYSKAIQRVLRELLHGISENLGLEEGYIDEALKLDSSFQLFAVNLYPPCPQPDQAIGLPPHTDYGMLTFVVHNGVAGLQIEHNGEWFNVDSPPNSILINVADHLEIFSNGRYKSLIHRAAVNDSTTRISIVLANGAALDAVVGPADPLVERDGSKFYTPMKFMDFVKAKVSDHRLHSKSLLEAIKIVHDDNKI